MNIHLTLPSPQEVWQAHLQEDLLELSSLSPASTPTRTSGPSEPGMCAWTAEYKIIPACNNITVNDLHYTFYILRLRFSNFNSMYYRLALVYTL